MQWLNMVPIVAFLWIVLQAVRRAFPRDAVDHYFQEERYNSGKKRYINLFGVPKADFEHTN